MYFYSHFKDRKGESCLNQGKQTTKKVEIKCLVRYQENFTQGEIYISKNLNLGKHHTQRNAERRPLGSLPHEVFCCLHCRSSALNSNHTFLESPEVMT